MLRTLAPQEPFLVAEWRKPPGFARVFLHNTGRLAPYRYQSRRTATKVSGIWLAPYGSRFLGVRIQTLSHANNAFGENLLGCQIGDVSAYTVDGYRLLKVPP